jgi:hypothetical protein
MTTATQRRRAQLSRAAEGNIVSANALAREAGIPRSALRALTLAAYGANASDLPKANRAAAKIIAATLADAEPEEKKKKVKKTPKDKAPKDDAPDDDAPTDEDEEDETIDDGEEGGTDEEEAGLPRFLEPAKKKKKASARSLAARISAIEEERIDADIMPDMLRRDLAARGLPTTFSELRDLEIEAEHDVMRAHSRASGTPYASIEPDERQVLDEMARASGFAGGHAEMLKASKAAEALAPGLVRPVGSPEPVTPTASRTPTKAAPQARQAFRGHRKHSLESGSCRVCSQPIAPCTLVLSSADGMACLGCGVEVP